MTAEERTLAKIAADRMENIAATLSICVLQAEGALDCLHHRTPDAVDWKAILPPEAAQHLMGIEEHLPYARNLLDAMRQEIHKDAANLRERIKISLLGNGGRT